MNKHFCFYCMSPVNEDGSCPVCGLTAGAYQPAPHHIPPGTILLNRYLFGRVLGEGGFGITYIACDLRLDLKVAIKEYFPTDKATRHSAASLDVTTYTGTAASNYESCKRKFLSEARTMAKMDKQPEVVSVRDFFELNNTAYIVMEFVDGTNFRELVKQQGGKIPAQQLLTTIEPLFDALSAMHSAGLIHRDISPDNLMLEHGKVRLLDFGCARESATGTDTLTIALKHGFAPIEQYTNHGQGPWTDIYALAGTIYFCITGKAPVRSTDRLLGDELILPSKLGIELTRQQEKALLRAMAIQPRRRFQTMEEFRAALYAPDEDPIFISEPEPDVQNGQLDTVDAQEVLPGPELGTMIPNTATVAVAAEPEMPEQNPETNTLPAKQKPKYWIPAIAGIVLLLLVAVIVPLTRKTPETQIPETSDSQTENTVASNTVSGVCGADGEWVLDLDSGVLTVSGDIGNYELGEQPWYPYADVITHVVIGNDIYQIGSWAFGNLPNLNTAEIGSGVIQINASAFDHSPLTEITLPEGLIYIDDNAFSGTHLTQVEIPASVTKVDYQAFEHCPNLQKVTFLGARTLLRFERGDRMFTDGNGNIPEGFMIQGYSCSAVQEFAEIYGYEFRPTESGEWDGSGKCGDNITFCFDLESGLLKLEGTGPMWDFNGTWMVNFPDSWVAGLELPPWTRWQEAIRCVSIGNGITTVGDNAFENCHNLYEVQWNNTVESIGFHAFLDTVLERLVLPMSVREIEEYAFNYCRNLSYVVLPDTLPVLRKCVFPMCLNLQSIYIGRDTVVMNDGTETPFNQNNITEDGTDERQMPPDLTIYGLQNSDAEWFAGKYGIPFIIGYHGLIADYEGPCGDDVWFFADESEQTLVLYGTGATWSFDYENRPLFADLDCIRHVKVLPGVEGLGDNLFLRMKQIESVDLGTVKTMGLGVLSETSVQDVVLPETLTLLRGWNMSYCEELRSVSIPGDCEVELSVFHNTPSLREVTFGPAVHLQDSEQGNLFWERNTESSYTPSDELVFHVVEGSDAERYAKQYGIRYEYIE